MLLVVAEKYRPLAGEMIVVAATVLLEALGPITTRC
jgi:hypothetical protein